MKYTYAQQITKRQGNFSTLTFEEYGLFKKISISIIWHPNGNSDDLNSELVYKAKIIDINLEKARRLTNERLKEKLEVFSAMERNGKLQVKKTN